MRTQALRFFLMVVLVIMVAFVTALASANAQTPNRNISVDIPFEFSVGDQTLPAGRYILGQLSSKSVALHINNLDNAETAQPLTAIVRASEAKQESVLVFQRYGNSYFLSQVWVAGERTGREMLKSDRELAIERDVTKRNGRLETLTLSPVQPTLTVKNTTPLIKD